MRNGRISAPLAMRRTLARRRAIVGPSAGRSALRPISNQTRLIEASRGYEGGNVTINPYNLLHDQLNQLAHPEASVYSPRARRLVSLRVHCTRPRCRRLWRVGSQPDAPCAAQVDVRRGASGLWRAADELHKEASATDGRAPAVASGASATAARGTGIGTSAAIVAVTRWQLCLHAHAAVSGSSPLALQRDRGWSGVPPACAARR